MKFTPYTYNEAPTGQIAPRKKRIASSAKRVAMTILRTFKAKPCGLTYQDWHRLEHRNQYPRDERHHLHGINF